VDLLTLIDALTKPKAYPYLVEKVEVRQTHISVVFLAGSQVYKIKKPINLAFLDFSTLAKRHHFCDEEVRLNRRLAPHVYQGVVPITQSDGTVRFEGQGVPVEWAVKMERLPDEATLLRRLQSHDLESAMIEAVARKLADFHASAEASDRISEFGSVEVVAGNARENFEQSIPHVGTTVSSAVFDRLKKLTDESLTRLRPLIESRAKSGIPRDTHGDLRLEHIYFFPEQKPPANLVLIDCIEFNERFRFADPVADIAFLVMDFLFHGRRDLAEAFAIEYFRASGDDEGKALLPFYTAYRSAVRGKVNGFKLQEKEVPKAEQARALTKAKAHWLLALGELETPNRRPCLILIGGLPGTGKSTLANALADRGGYQVIRSDVVRKELAGIAENVHHQAGFAQGIYTPKWTQRTYAECLRRAESLLFEGKRVIVDANFPEERWRRAFLDAASRLSVSAIFLLCAAKKEAVRTRLQRRRADVSDADVRIYEQAARRWETPGRAIRGWLREVDTNTRPEESLHQAERVLRERGLGD
jgi:aminoglycoside phosphotransferase family enzyme/predicted kinase